MKKITTLIFCCITATTLFFACSKSATSPKPVASFNWVTTNSTAPSLVTFTNTSTDATTYSWDFGDGGNSTLASPTHTYISGGSYSVTLTATGAGGTSSTSLTITISNPTALQIKITDNLGNAVSGASVKLYNTITDWTNGTNQILNTLTSNSSGIVTFQPLNAAKYYWLATLSCQSNVFGSNTTTNALTANITNTVTTVLGNTSTLNLTSNSTNPYSISFDGTILNSSMAGGSSVAYTIASGTHSVVVTQLSGYVLVPTVKTYTFTVTCGQSGNVLFPN